MSGVSKVRALTDRQTDRQTDTQTDTHIQPDALLQTHSWVITIEGV